MKKISIILLFLSSAIIYADAKPVTLVIPGTKVAGGFGSQSSNPSQNSTTTKFKCTPNGNCFTIVYDDGQNLANPAPNGSAVIPEGEYAQPFPVLIIDAETGEQYHLDNVIIYNEQNEIDPTGLIIRSYEFTHLN